MSCPKCGAEMEGGICNECGFPVIRIRWQKIYLEKSRVIDMILRRLAYV